MKCEKQILGNDFIVILELLSATKVHFVMIKLNIIIGWVRQNKDSDLQQVFGELWQLINYAKAIFIIFIIDISYEIVAPDLN